MTEKQVQEWLEGDTKHRTGKHESKMSRELNPVVRRTHDKVVSSMNPVKKATESVLKMQLEIEKAGKELAWMKRRTGRMQTGSPTKDDPDPSKYPEVYHQREELDKGDEMDEEVEKEMKGPESTGVKKPGKIPLSANKQAITEEPATVSSTSQNYKNTPDMNKGDDVDKAYSKTRQGQEKPHHANDRVINRDLKRREKDEEPISKSDEAALKKCITDATTIFKGMTLMLDKGTLKENRAGKGDLKSKMTDVFNPGNTKNETLRSRSRSPQGGYRMGLQSVNGKRTGDSDKW